MKFRFESLRTPDGPSISSSSSRHAVVAPRQTSLDFALKLAFFRGSLGAGGASRVVMDRAKEPMKDSRVSRENAAPSACVQLFN